MNADLREALLCECGHTRVRHSAVTGQCFACPCPGFTRKPTAGEIYKVFTPAHGDLSGTARTINT